MILPLIIWLYYRSIPATMMKFFRSDILFRNQNLNKRLKLIKIYFLKTQKSRKTKIITSANMLKSHIPVGRLKRKQKNIYNIDINAPLKTVIKSLIESKI